MANASLSVGETMIYTTTRVVGLDRQKPVGTGTGFFYRVDVAPEKAAAVLVTNKHVVEGCDAILVNVHIADSADPTKPSGQFAPCVVEFKGGIVDHPDADVDLCAIPIDNLIGVALQKGVRPYVVTMTKQNLPAASDWDNFGALETVTMVGCPNGLFDEAHNLPLSRQGITASQLKIDFQGKPQFAVDMACFPGSSGSPIFVQDNLGYRDQKTNTIHFGRNRFLLVGILFEGPLIESDGTVTLGRKATFSIASMMHLGYAIKSNQLLAFDAHFQAEYDRQLGAVAPATSP